MAGPLKSKEYRSEGSNSDHAIIASAVLTPDIRVRSVLIIVRSNDMAVLFDDSSTEVSPG
jgi:hypothetical protein